MKRHTFTQKILIYTEDYGIGGIAAFNDSLLQHFTLQPYQVFCVQSKISSPRIDRNREDGVQYVWLNFDTMQEWSRAAYNLEDATNIFTDVNPDLIIFSDGWPMSSFAAKQVAIRFGIPYIICIGFMQSSYVGFTRGDGIPYIDAVHHQYLLAQDVIAVSSENLESLRKTFRLSSDLGRVIHYGRPSEYFVPPLQSNRQRLRQELDIPEDAVVCFTAARLTTIKGYQYQMQAIARLRNSSQWSNLYFIWAGTGSGSHPNLETELKKQVEVLGVADHIKFLGQRWNIPELLDASDIFVLPSEVEGMPLAVMEAMAKGLPVIASAVSGIPEELGNTGKLLTDPNVDPVATVNDLVQTIEAWSADKILRLSAGRACQHRAEQMFTEERMLDEYETVIYSSLEKNARSAQLGVDHKSSKALSQVDQCLQYNFWVWKAWDAYYNEQLEKMAEYLTQSIKLSPFLAIETTLHWIQSFQQSSQEIGIRWDVVSLVRSDGWRNIARKAINVLQPKICKL